MATGTFSSEPSPPPVSYDRVIEEQLRATQTQVKLVDILTSSLLLFAGALAYMLIVAWIDHWVMAFGFWMRLFALLGLLGGAGWWFTVRILPLIIRRINPVYAAQTIEQAEPTLKNSLINFLLLRNDRQKVHNVVYHAVGQRAASDLSQVPAENIVDYSPLLKIGYVLAALVVVGAIYKIVSPKDPFQSAARIAAPWADVERPSRVVIEDVTPGDVSLFQGEQITVSAVIEGVGNNDPAYVLFSTIDGQVVDQQVPLQLDEAGLRHVAQIPGNDYGAQSSLQYRVVAGDAQTRWYNVEVVPAPHILITKVEYTPPRYTKREPVVDTRGDIDGVEGSYVTLHARANREIASATLEFDPLPDGVTAEARAAVGSETIRITKIEGQELQVGFYLRLKSDRATPWHDSYAIRFNTADGYRNQDPVVHTLDVKPDLAPLVEILEPIESEAEVPINRKLKIQTRSIDPDFALSRVRLVAVSGGRDLLDVELLESSAGHSGQAISSFEFAPASYDLAVGDEVEYWAIAQDNRTAVRTGEAEPNITRSTPNYRLRIVAPERSGEAATEDEAPREDESVSEEGTDSSAGGTPESPSNNGGGSESSSDENSAESGSENASEESSSEGNSGGGNDSSTGSQGSESSESSDDASGDSGGSSSSLSGDSQKGNSESSDGSGDTSGSSGNSESGSDSQEGSPKSGNRGGDASRNGAQPSGPRDEPLENDGSRDGDIFEAINEHRRQENGASNSQDGDTGQEDLRDNLNDNGAEGSQPSDASSNSNPSDSNSGDNGNSAAGSQQKQNGNQNNQGGSNSQSGGSNNQGKQKNQSGGGEQSSGSATSQENQTGGSSDSEQQSGSAGNQQKDGNQSSGSAASQDNQGGANDQQQNQNAGGSDSEGGQPQGGAKPEGQKNQGGESGEQSQGGGMGQNDQSGAGQKTDGGGSPQSQAEDQQRNKEKSGGSQQGGQQQDQGGKSPGGSKKDSDSQGGSGGDRKGGGEQGGGQSSKQQGQDSAGSSSSGEQGDGAANEPGAGQTGNRAGGDQIADSPTGRSGEQAGEGSSTGQTDGGRKNQDQSQSGNDRADNPSSSGSQSGGGRPQDGSPNPQDPSGERITDTSGEGRGTLPTGGGKPADNHRSDVPLPDVEPGGDKANLDYARKATDLTLEYLKNQKDKPDPALLDKLGWNKEDLNKFVQRWERRKKLAAGAGEDSAESRRLDESLRSLGLRPPRDNFRTGDEGTNRLSGQRDGAARSKPPKEYADQYRAFSKFATP